MNIKICGRKVRWRKPIKLHALMKASSAMLFLCALITPPAQAAEPVMSHMKKASTCVAVPCPPSTETGMTNAPATTIKPQHKPQRTAGSPSMSPAMALAMALGVRNVRGPVEYSQPVMVRHGVSKSMAKQVALLPGEKSRNKNALNAAAVRLALDD